MPKYGSERRRELREAQAETKLTQARQEIEELWRASTESGDTDIDAFYQKVYEHDLKSDYASNQERKIFREALRDFVRTKADGGVIISIPGKIPVLERRAPTKGRNWMLRGKEVRNASQKTLKHWDHTEEYTDREALGWLVFSAAVWGGLNEPDALESLLDAVRRKTKMYWVGDYPTLNLSVKSPYYGNWHDSDGLKQCVQFVPDVITSMWLVHCYRRIRVMKPTSGTMEECFDEATRSAGISIPLESLLEGASYIWELAPGSSVTQALSRVATGDQKTCSLSVPEFARTMSEQLVVRTSPYRPLSGNQRSDESLDASLLDPRNAQRKDRDKELRQAIKKFIYARDERRKVSWREESFARCQRLVQQFGFPHERRLIEWTHAELDLDRQPRIAPSTVERYFDAIAEPWLKTVLGEDLDLLDAQGWESLYDDAIQGAKGDQSYRRRIFQQFHQFQVSTFEAPPVVLVGERAAEVCRARFVSPRFMDCVIRSLRLWTDIHELERESLEVMIMLAWRTGMRVSEITGLSLKDLDCTPPTAGQPGRIHTLTIRSNNFSKNKTGNAYRRIPVGSLMRPDELERLDKVWRFQLALKGWRLLPLFSPPHVNLPFSSNYVSSVFRDLVDSVMPGNGYSFHSLRHTALSTFDLILTRQTELLAILSDLSEQQHDEIRRAILGRHPGNPDQEGQDYYFALAQCAGHYLPDQTFRSYLHFAHLSLGIRIRQGAVTLPAKAVCNIVRLTRRQLVIDIDGFDKKSTHVNTLEVAPLIDKALTQWEGVWERQTERESFEAILEKGGTPATASLSELGSRENHLPEPLSTGVMEEFPGRSDSRLTMDVVYTAIAKVESGSAESETAYQLGLPASLVSRWVQRAHVLANLESSRGSPRLIDPERLENSEVRPLLPLKAFSEKEQKMLSLALYRAAHLFGLHKKDLLMFMNCYLNRITGSRSMIRFTERREDDMIEFLTVAVRLFPPASWLLHCHDKRQAIKVLRSNKALSNVSIGRKRTTDYKGYGITLKHPEDNRIVKQDAKKSHYSTNVLKYLVHMMLIAWPAGHQGRKKVHFDPVARLIEKGW